jgi:uncharacterized protein (DUF305 family)
MRRSARILVSAGALVGVLTLTACGSPDHDMSTMPAGSGGSSSTATAATTPAGSFNTADVTFAKGMIPHHAQAITMAEMATSQAASGEVKNLASAIKSAQGPEIEQLSAWLRGWGEPVPDTGAGHHMADGDMAGTMMTEQEMADLSAARGSRFDAVWLQMMIKHHEGAITMAKTEVSEGTNPEAKKLAQDIITAQAAEITTMKGLLAAQS